MFLFKDTSRNKFQQKLIVKTKYKNKNKIRRLKVSNNDLPLLSYF